jgi:putative ABC transport system permease protein
LDKSIRWSIAWVGTITPMLTTMPGAVAVLLLLATVNVANLLVARGVSRRHEMSSARRSCCSRWRLVRELLVERPYWRSRAAPPASRSPSGLIHSSSRPRPTMWPRLANIQMDATAWAFALSVSVASAFILSVLPGIQSSAFRSARRCSRRSGDTSTASANRLRRGPHGR